MVILSDKTYLRLVQKYIILVKFKKNFEEKSKQQKDGFYNSKIKLGGFFNK